MNKSSMWEKSLMMGNYQVGFMDWRERLKRRLITYILCVPFKTFRYHMYLMGVSYCTGHHHTL